MQKISLLSLLLDHSFDDFLPLACGLDTIILRAWLYPQLFVVKLRTAASGILLQISD